MLKAFSVRSRIVTTAAVSILLLAGLATQGAMAQPKKPAPAPAAAPAATPGQDARPAAQPSGTEAPKPAGNWSSRCVSESRGGQTECVVEQNAVITNTGQLVASVTVRLPAGATEPVMMVQVPVGLFVPAGITLQIDSAKAETLPIQTCDLKGCFAAQPLTADRLNAMKGGKRLTVAFQNLGRQTISIPFVLETFADAYKKIQ